MAIGVCPIVAPFLLDGGLTGQTAFVFAGFALPGLAHGQAADPVASNASHHIAARLK